jgi:hypothetical protein
MNQSLHLTIQHGLGRSILINKEIVVDYIPAIQVLIAMRFTKKVSLYLLTKSVNKISYSGVFSLLTTSERQFLLFSELSPWKVGPM